MKEHTAYHIIMCRILHFMQNLHLQLGPVQRVVLMRLLNACVPTRSFRSVGCSIEQEPPVQQDVVLEMLVGALQKQNDGSQAGEVDTAVEQALASMALPAEIPEPHPPNCRKRDLYYDASVFKELDEYVFSVSSNRGIARE